MLRAKHVKTEYEQSLRLYRKGSARHVLILEADMSEDMKRRTFGLSDELRIYGNNLTAKLSKSMEQLFRTKKYKSLQKAYGKLSEIVKSHPDNKAVVSKLKAVTNKMSDMQKEYGVTWADARTYMMYLKDRAGLNSIFSLTRAEDIWSGAEKVIFGGADTIHFKKRGILPEIRAKQPNRGIVISVNDNQLYFKCSDIGKEAFTYKQLDKFQADEVSNVLKYLESPVANDEAAVSEMLETGEIIDTFRPCYASLVCKRIRGELRVYIHLTIEGRALPKFKADRITPRHTLGKGRVGADIGTQTVAYTSKHEVGLKNLSERGMTISHAERQERLLLHKMDRSRRATNPDNYNPDGTVKKGFKVWYRSNRYKRIQQKHAELCRRNAESRKYAINEDANHLRSLGDELITEPANFKALQRKAKPETEPETGRSKRRKRFGKSLKNRCPGAFQAALKSKFEATDGSYHEVDRMYRASQYDHTVNDYIKKKLSQRMFELAKGPKVQRDWYSSFLLYNSDRHYIEPDRQSCIETFNDLYSMEIDLINNIKAAGIHVLNSGIAA